MVHQATANDHRLPRLACSRSIASNSALKLPLPNPCEPCRSISRARRCLLPDHPGSLAKPHRSGRPRRERARGRAGQAGLAAGRGRGRGGPADRDPQPRALRRGHRRAPRRGLRAGVRIARSHRLWASPNDVSHPSQDGQVRLACSMHRIKRDRTVEGDKPAVVTGGQGQQVGVGHLTWTDQA
jgi:hypothetical protein